ncbi:hypothetical protein SBA4_3330017 [Candidatus Sulfopaludibacter sp. SbA4]|nr:hypothetical protein SBA4_3330017 [Candidatus Sulfopaludibacter sp. SbA4]
MGEVMSGVRVSSHRLSVLGKLAIVEASRRRSRSVRRMVGFRRKASEFASLMVSHPHAPTDQDSAGRKELSLIPTLATLGLRDQAPRRPCNFHLFR